MANIIKSISKRLLRRGQCKLDYGFEHPIRVDKKTKLSRQSFVGRYSYVGKGTAYCDVRIGRYCSIADGFVFIGDDHHLNFLTTHPFPYSNQMFGENLEYRDIDFKKTDPRRQRPQHP